MANITRAAGAVVWRMHMQRLEVLLIHRPRYDDWSWPKGKVRKRETLPECAVREVKEETGVDVVLGVPLPQVRYKVASDQPKVSWYWAATPVDEDADVLIARKEFAPCSPEEVDQARWVEAVQALRMLTRRTDRAPLIALLDLHADEELRTWPVLLTRHARAKGRSAWAGDEATRPLTPGGQKQARALVGLFAAYGAGSIISSPWERCAGTVRPFAQALGLTVRYAPELTEAAAASDEGAVRASVSAALRDRTAKVVCTHRPVIPAAIAAITRRAPHYVREVLPEDDPYLRTGEILVVHVGKRPGKKHRVVAVETHRVAS